MVLSQAIILSSCFRQERPAADGNGDGGASLVLPGAALRRIITVGGSNGGGGDASFASSADSDGVMSEKTHKVRYIRRN